MSPVKQEYQATKVYDQPTAESPTALPAKTAELAIAGMIATRFALSPLHILSITSPVRGISAVAIEPPYREFPNIVLFQYEEGARRWVRIREGLSLGLQTEVSDILDLHTLGIALDIAQPDATDQRVWMPPALRGQGQVVIPYDRFVHVHPSGPESYYLDKRDYARLARQVLQWKRSYPDTECTLFDQPGLLGISLGHDLGRFVLTARTANHQEWTVTFTGIEGSGELQDKIITADVVQ
jgi:hypothetical protein